MPYLIQTLDFKGFQGSYAVDGAELTDGAALIRLSDNDSNRKFQYHDNDWSSR